MTFRDPMLHAASEALRGHPDHLRWLSYADDELHRLRERAGLPTPKGYNVGRPDYTVGASPRALGMVAEVERRLNGKLRPDDRRAIAEVLDEIIDESVGVER